MKDFKLIVAGGRDFNSLDLLQTEMDSLILEGPLKDYRVSIVSGMARGADKLAYDFCMQLGVQCHEFPADWGKYGKRAGYLRNESMAQFADGLLAFWDGRSRGTHHMIKTMKHLGKPVRVIDY